MLLSKMLLQGKAVTASAAGSPSKNGGKSNANGGSIVSHNKRGATKKNSQRGKAVGHGGKPSRWQRSDASSGALRIRNHGLLFFQQAPLSTTSTPA